MEKIVEFQNYTLSLTGKDGREHELLKDMSFELQTGRALGIVGESGCGKSMTSLSLMRLLPGAAKVSRGRILFNGEDLLKKDVKEMEDIRGREISMIFQEPMTSLNPVYSVGFQIEEVIKVHKKDLSKKQRREMVIEILTKVGISNPEKRINQFPHEFSGGMRQRIMIAMALVCHPKLLVADEPTTALDVTIQAQVLDLMKKLKTNGSMIMITHNLGVVADVCDDIIVMYAGSIVEKGDLRSVIKNPKHPYTKGLIASVPKLNSKGRKLHTIKGSVPPLEELGEGCRFASRCSLKDERCHGGKPPLRAAEENHYYQCWK